jgi:Ser/Thr protein kinase RdoA (MazF antagonist)
MDKNKAPRVRVHTLDGSYLQLSTTSAEDVLEIVAHLDAAYDGVYSFDLDNGRSQVHIPHAAIARVDIDWELSLFDKLRARASVILNRWF